MTPEFILVAVACGVGCAIGTWRAALHKAKHVDYAFKVIEVVREYEPDEGTIMEDAQLSFADAIEHRNQVLDAVADSNTGWLALALEAMQKLPDGTERTGEGFRMLLLERGLPEPAHVNAWGALTGTLSRRRVLVATGEWQPMRQKSSHGRLTRVYRKQTPQADAA